MLYKIVASPPPLTSNHRFAPLSHQTSFHFLLQWFVGYYTTTRYPLRFYNLNVSTMTNHTTSSDMDMSDSNGMKVRGSEGWLERSGSIKHVQSTANITNNLQRLASLLVCSP